MKRIVAVLLIAVLLIGVAGCKSSKDKSDAPLDPTTTAQITTPQVTTPLVTTPIVDTTLHAGHKPGDCFPMTIMLEGMEETVMAQHFVNQSEDYCIDYFYEDFELMEGVQGESFVWNKGYDDSAIFGYLCISVIPGLRAEDQAQLVSLRMDAKAEMTKFSGYDALRIAGSSGDTHVTYYLFDTPRGCVEIEIACITEALEGIGTRMYAMLDTLQIYP